MSALISRTLSVVVAPEGEPIYSERAFVVSIEDEAAGEFVSVTSQEDSGGHERRIRIDPGEWPELRDAIDSMVSNCRS